MMELVFSYSTSSVKQEVLAGENDLLGGHSPVARGRGSRVDVFGEAL